MEAPHSGRTAMRRPVLSENHIRTYWWWSPDKIGMATMTPDRWTARPPLADGRLPRGGWNKHDSGGLFVRWPVFIGRRESGRITMDQMTRRAFGAAGLLLLLATSATFAQQ